MAVEIIRKLKNKIKIMWVVVAILAILLAGTSAYHFIKCKTFESKAETIYTVPERTNLQYFPKSEKRRKKV